MAMRLGSRSNGDDLEVQHEINVTPFKDEPIFVRGDKELVYGLIEVMNMLRDAGYPKLALVGLEAPAAKP